MPEPQLFTEHLLSTLEERAKRAEARLAEAEASVTEAIDYLRAGEPSEALTVLLSAGDPDV